MMPNLCKQQDGFTIIEALVAVTILVVGILSLYSMHTVAMRGNFTANTITTSANMGVDAMEQTLSLAFDHTDLQDGDGANDGCAGLNDTSPPDHGPVVDGIYTYYWNVAHDCTLSDVPAATNQRPKHIRVIVERDILGEEKQIVFNYIKQSNI